MEGSAEPRQLSALPKDVLRIILKKLSLEDRLRLELLNKSHRDTMREPELWQEVDLSAMQALNLTEDQLLRLLGRIDPGLKQVSSRVKIMATILADTTSSFMQQAPSLVRRMFHQLDDMAFPNVGADMLSIAALTQNISAEGADSILSVITDKFAQFLSQALRPISSFAHAFLGWFAELVKRIRWLFELFLQILKNPEGFPRRIDVDLCADDKFGFRTGFGETAIRLDVSGARRLSPEFLAACIIALSAAGHKVDFKNDGESDSPFPLHHLVSLLRILAPDCTIRVNLLICAVYPGWKEHFLKDFNPAESAAEQDPVLEFDPQQSLDEVMMDYRNILAVRGSEASNHEFSEKVLALLFNRSAITSAAGRLDDLVKGCPRPKVAAATVVFQWCAIRPNGLIYEDLREFLQKSPSELRLVFRNCLLRSWEVRSLCELLGECGAGSIAFQQSLYAHVSGFCSLSMEVDVLSSAALQKSKNLRTLEVDCVGLSGDIDAAAMFLDRSENFAQLVIHTKCGYFDEDLERARRLSSETRDVCASERGSRVTFDVQHWTPSFSEDGADLSDAPFLQIRQETTRRANLPLCPEFLLNAVNLAVNLFAIVVALLFVACYFGVNLFSYPLQPVHLSFAASLLRTLWPALRVILEGETGWFRTVSWITIAACLGVSAWAMWMGVLNDPSAIFHTFL